MATDPFPNTSDPTTEHRLRVLFSTSSTVMVLTTDPLELKEGQLWFNLTSQELKCYAGGQLWKIGSGSVIT